MTDQAPFATIRQVRRTVRVAACLAILGMVVTGSAAALDSKERPRVRFQIGHNHYSAFVVSSEWTQRGEVVPGIGQTCTTEGGRSSGGPFYYPTVSVPKNRVNVAFNMRRAERPARLLIRDRRAKSADEGYGHVRLLRRKLRPLRYDGRVFAWRAVVRVKGKGAHLLVARSRWPTKGVCSRGAKRYINASFSFFLGPRF